MSQTSPSPDDEIDLLELFMILWEGKWLIIASGIGAVILVMLYSMSLPSSYSGSTFVKGTQPSAFTAYTFLSDILKDQDTKYKINDTFVFNAFISEFNDLEEVMQTLRKDENFAQKLSEIEKSEQDNFIISHAKQFEILQVQNGKEFELQFTWGDIDDGKRIFDTSLQLVLTNVKATLSKDIDQFAQGAQSKLDIKIEKANLKKRRHKRGNTPRR